MIYSTPPGATPLAAGSLRGGRRRPREQRRPAGGAERALRIYISSKHFWYILGLRFARPKIYQKRESF